MQYGVEIFPYRRSKKIDSTEKTKRTMDTQLILKYIGCFFVCFLISRAKLIDNTAPFGVAFLISVLSYLNNKFSLAASVGAVLGYLSLIGDVKHAAIYVVIICTIFTLNRITENLTKYKRLIFILGAITLEILISNFFVSKLDFNIAFFYTLLEVICIIPVYFILDYGILCYKEIQSKHLFNNEEIVSMGIIICLMVAGTCNINILNISAMNILGLLVVLIISYICGSTTGAATGVAMGVIVGMSSSNMIIFISMYGICGLITGIFREAGKWLSALSCLVAFFIIQIYLGDSSQFKGIDVVIAGFIFLVISKKIYSVISINLNPQQKKANISENYINKVKNIYVERLDEFSDLLLNMGNILDNLVDNDKLVMKTKSSALIENLADRVCANCDMKSICWKREIYYTYSAFGELIENYQGKKYVIPSEIERKCIKRTKLIKNTEDIVNKHIIDEMRKTSLSEGRELLVKQINNMASSVKEIVDEFKCDIKIDTNMEVDLRRMLDKNQIKYKEVICLEDDKGKVSVKVSMNACGGKQLCVKEILPFMNDITGKCMCVSDEGCCIDSVTGLCNVTYEETPKYHVSTYAAIKCKDGEKCNGDSYSYSKLKDGTFMSVISDGMGSGPQAGRESKAAVQLLKKFTGAGFSKLTAINAVNSVMSMKFSEEEKFSTVDLNSIDLYTGTMSFMKVGAVASFIKSNDKIEVIKSKTLPMGVLDKVDIEIQKRKVKNGDLVIMISDGVLDYNDKNIGKANWIIDYLKNNNSNNPKEVAFGLLNEAIKLCGYKVKDDMTILVSKVHCLY